MNPKQLAEGFQQLPSATQVALVILALVIVVLLVVYPTAGTSIITFLVALKVLATQR